MAADNDTCDLIKNLKNGKHSNENYTSELTKDLKINLEAMSSTNAANIPSCKAVNFMESSHLDDEDVFEKVFDNSMNDLEDELDGYQTSSEAESDSNSIDSISQPNSTNSIVQEMEILSECQKRSNTLQVPPPPLNSSLTTRATSSGSESDDEDDNPDKIIQIINKSPKLLPSEHLNHKMFMFRPYLLPFQERRRLSQCKEEDENEENSNENSKTSGGNNGNTGSNSKNCGECKIRGSAGMSAKFKQMERIREQFRKQLEPKAPSTKEEKPISEIETKVNRFSVTKTVETNLTNPSSGNSIKNNLEKLNQIVKSVNDSQQKLRSEAERLRNLNSQMNAFTIHFPCSQGTNYSNVRNLFSNNKQHGNTTISSDVPHLDKQFFDVSLVEIKPISVSTKSLDKCDIVRNDDIWKPRGNDDSAKVTPASSKNSVSFDEQDANKSGSSQRPSSAPTESNSKAARKQSKKMEKEARRQEKELRHKEKEARKIERETARRLEREAAKLERFNRNTEKIARSTERLAPRSGSLERRRSGEDSPVLNQSTVHGIASPNRRPTIFDVFRPRTKSDAKRKDKEVHKLSGSEKDNSSTSSNHSDKSGGIMQAMKHAVQNTVGHRHSSGQHTSASKYKDGSAHPHAGSDAQYYHTVTAVRRADVSRSPMTKVMDLFRHRSNSAVNEADKRKARAAAHQQLLAVQNV